MREIGKIIAALIIGIFIVLAAIIIAKPSYADEGWSLAMGLLSVLGIICVVGVIAIVIIVIVALIFAYKFLAQLDF